MSPAFHASKAARTISTFSCDIAYSERPAASRASRRDPRRTRCVTTLPLAQRPDVQFELDLDAASRASPMQRADVQLGRSVDDSEVSSSSSARRLQVVAAPLQARNDLASRPASGAGSGPTRCRDRRCHGGIEVPAISRAVARVDTRRAISTFSCDIARAVSRRLRSRRERLAPTAPRLRGPRLRPGTVAGE